MRSPIKNLGIDPAEFQEAVVAEFRDMYGAAATAGPDVVSEIAATPDVEKGLRSSRYVQKEKDKGKNKKWRDEQ